LYPVDVAKGVGREWPQSVPPPSGLAITDPKVSRVSIAMIWTLAPCCGAVFDTTSL
jgi:hypothetical protein